MKIMMVAAALAGWAQTAEARPAWCQGDAGRGNLSITKSDGSFKYATAADDDSGSFTEIVNALCSSDPQAEPFRAQLEAARARWSKRLHMTDADWNDALPFATEMQVFRVNLEIDLQKQHDAFSDMTPVEQFDAFKRIDTLDQIHLADVAASHLTWTGRLGYIARCVEAEDLDPVENALCGHDIATFDVDKLNAELRADTADAPETRMTMRLLYDRLARFRFPKRMAVMRALVAKDEGYAKLFKIAKQTQEEWDAKASELAPYRETAWQMFVAEETGSKKARAGCEEKTWAPLVEAIRGISASDYQTAYKADKSGGAEPLLRLVMATPKGFLAASSFAACAALHKTESPSFAGTARALASQPGFTGPRSAVLTNLLAANIELDRGSIDYPKPDHGFYRDESHRAYGSGVLASVKANGSSLHLEFKPIVHVEEQCTGGFVPTRQIIGIRDDGSFTFQQRCTGYGMVKVNTASRPMDVAAKLAPGLKAGMNVVADGDTAVIAWEPKAKVPSIVLGQAVK